MQPLGCSTYNLSPLFSCLLVVSLKKKSSALWGRNRSSWSNWSNRWSSQQEEAATSENDETTTDVQEDPCEYKLLWIVGTNNSWLAGFCEFNYVVENRTKLIVWCRWNGSLSPMKMMSGGPKQPMVEQLGENKATWARPRGSTFC